MKFQLDGNEEHEIKVKITKEGTTVSLQTGDISQLNTTLRTGEIVFDIKPKLRRIRNKPPAQKITEAGNIAKPDETDEDHVVT